MQDCSTTLRRSVSRSMWLALWVVLGCGTGTEPEMLGDPVLAAGAAAPGSGGPLGDAPGMSAAGASAAVSGSATAGIASSAAAAAGAGSAGSNSASGVNTGGPAANSMTTSVGTNSTSGAAGSNSAGGANTGAAGAAAARNSGAAGAQASSGAAGSGGMHAGAAGSGMPAASNASLTVYIASDSTASNYKDTGSDKDQAGWGQMLPDFVKPNAKIDNRAIGGRTARRFIDEGRLDEIWKDIKTGDYLLVQFGTNDGNKTATYELNGQQIPYYLDPETDFKTYIKKYIEGAQQHGAVLVLVTPPPRNSAYCTGGNGTGAHAQALRELGESEKVLVVDLNQKAVDYLKAICPEPSPPNFFLQKPDGSVDGTHFQKAGARKLASFVAEGLRTGMVGWIKD